MIKQHIAELIQQALSKLNISSESQTIQIDATKDAKFGDFSCNIALLLAKQTQKKPRELAELIVSALEASPKVAKVEIAGPGFINFFLAKTAFYQLIPEILKAGDEYGKAELGQGQKIIVEFVSSNPTGPLHVGHGRHAAYGASVCNLLEKIGYKVHREYYVNDAGRQMDILTVSVWLRYLSLLGESIVFPANAYQGDYVINIAKLLVEKQKKDLHTPAEKVFSGLPPDEPVGGDKEIYIDAVIDRAKEILGEKKYVAVLQFTLENILADIREDLVEFGVSFDQWFSERELVGTGVIDRLIENLQKAGFIYERNGALWFRSTDFDDEKDRVLQRANGQRTYFANDLAYHLNKFERGFDRAITIAGSDHHGYVPRMKAGFKALGLDANKLAFPLVQFVTLYRGGKQAQMSTRSGSFVTLRELREEVGKDAARFFYVTRKCEQHMDFDLDLAKSQSNENPVYYIQYAYARIASVFRQLAEKNWVYAELIGLQHLELLTEPHELQLLSTLARYSEVIRNAGTQYEPHQLTHYLRELAQDFHGYYNSTQFLVEDETLRNTRLTLIVATRQILFNGLTLLGVSAPDSM